METIFEWILIIIAVVLACVGFVIISLFVLAVIGSIADESELLNKHK